MSSFPSFDHDLQRAITLNRQGHYHAAIELLRRVLSDDPESGAAHSILALALIGAKRNLV